jgi:uncharacterized 2Fe-2S/4Fe-4S cluster protein (DUF4445 family)
MLTGPLLVTTTPKVRVVFQPSGRKTDVDQGATILQAAREAEAFIQSVCGSKGTCGKCKVIVEESAKKLSKLTEAERFHLTPQEIEAGYRLACQVKVAGNVTVMVPLESLGLAHKILVEDAEKKVAFNPLTKVIRVTVPPPTISDQRSDLTRLTDTLREATGKTLKCDLEILRGLPERLRKADWKVSVIVWNDEIIDVKSSEEKSLFGLALDIGTTSIAGYLIDLANGKTVGASAKPNPQITYGDDVISRISYVNLHKDGLEKLRSAVVSGINEIINDLCARAGIRNADIYDSVFVGNTLMHHLFFGLNPKHLALAPYVPVSQNLISIKAEETGIKVNQNSYVTFPPSIAGFVGADVIGDILASGIHKSNKLTMLIDIGTNGEIVLGNKNGLTACSCAAGPAFEGGHIKCGMRAVAGAIERVKIDPEKGELQYKTIENRKPIGICGSGLVDIVANLLKARIINPSGNFNLSIENSRLRRKPLEFVIAWAAETATRKDIVLTQKDVRETQLAKSAIYTGAAILMKKMKVTTKDIKRIQLSGAFGNYIDSENAMTIGLLPEFNPRKIRSIGHGAGIGAKLALISKTIKRQTENITKKMNYIELSADRDFQKEFINALQFPIETIQKS